jgi:hypothetical protein
LTRCRMQAHLSTVLCLPSAFSVDLACDIRLLRRALHDLLETVMSAGLLSVLTSCEGLLRVDSLPANLMALARYPRATERCGIVWARIRLKMTAERKVAAIVLFMTGGPIVAIWSNIQMILTARGVDLSILLCLRV